MNRRRRNLPARRGAVLIVALIIIFALASLALTMGRGMRVEALASANQAAAHEADAIARGAEQYVLALLSERRSEVASLDERLFAAVPVGDGYFWIIRPNYDDPAMPAYGLVDESAKIHLNTATEEMLQRVPGLNHQIATAIVAWRSDEISSEAAAVPHAATNQVYLALPEPYQAKLAPFETVEELLLVHGMTHELLYSRPSPLAPALFDIFTVWSMHLNRSEDGRRRVHINNREQRGQLRRLLVETLGEERAAEAIGRIPNRNFRDIFDLAQQLQLQSSELELLEDRITTSNRTRLRGRINVNAAPREVLLALDELSEADVESLLAHRHAAAALNPASVAWVYDVLRERAVGLGGRITGQGHRFSADIVAVSGNGRAFSRVRIVVDASREIPRTLYRRDQTELGWPLEPSILASLRAGSSLDAVPLARRW